MDDIETKVYVITCLVSLKKYIGITKNTLRRRWRQHVKAAYRSRKERSAIYGAIRKYGEANFKIELLYLAATMDEAAVVEKGIIAARGTMYPTGYNMTCGGESTKGFKLSPSQINALRAANVGKKHSEEHKEKIRQSMLGRIISAETREKMSAANKLDPNNCRNRTHCPRGHPYDEVNTYRSKKQRSCRACRTVNARVRRKGPVLTIGGQPWL